MKPLLKLIFGWMCYALSPVIIIVVMAIGFFKMIFGYWKEKKQNKLITLLLKSKLNEQTNKP